MITAAVVGVVLIFVMAGLVGLHDSLRASSWREVAAERRMKWEARRFSPRTFAAARARRRQGPLESL